MNDPWAVDLCDPWGQDLHRPGFGPYQDYYTATLRGDWDVAAQIADDIRHICEYTVGESHITTIQSYRFLSIAMENQDLMSDALMWEIITWEGCKELFGVDHLVSKRSFDRMQRLEILFKQQQDEEYIE